MIARVGLCSRREAEAWIAQGRVAVNGKVLDTPAVTVTAADSVSVDGKPLAARQRTRLFLFHKPRGLVTTHKDPDGRRTIFSYLADHAPEAPRLLSIGRLDINTEGLLLLTNDGGLARILELPSTGWLRRYRVRAKGETTQAALDDLAKGITVDGLRYAPIDAKLDRQQGANCWLTMGLREGKNREIKRVLEHLGLVVNRLIRLSFGPFQLGELAEGRLEEVRTRVLRDQLGQSLATAAGCDFDAPIEIGTEDHGSDHPGAERRDARQGPARQGRPAHQGPARKAPRPKRAQPEPEAEKPRHRPQPGPRKHVSTLRSEARSDKNAPRQRITTGEIADRKGRTVEIERRAEAKPRPAKPQGPKPQGPKSQSSKLESSRRSAQPSQRPERGGPRDAPRGKR